MTLKVDDRIYAVKDHLEVASERLADANGLLAAGYPGFSARASYEVAYNTAIAILISYNLQVPQTHEGVNKSFHKNIVQGEKTFPPEVAMHLGALEYDRNIDQYKYHEQKLTPEIAQKDIEKAEIFLSAGRPIIEKRLEYLKSLSPESPELCIEEVVRNLHLLPDNPNIYSTPSKLVNYRGPILHVDQEQGFSVQQTGKATLVIHKHDALGRMPEKGENLQINYKHGQKAEVKTLQHSKSNG